MKNFLLKMRTILVVLSIIIACGFIIWIFNLLKGVVFNNNSYAGTIVFCVPSGIVICLLAYFLTRKSKKSFLDKENTNKNLQ